MAEYADHVSPESKAAATRKLADWNWSCNHGELFNASLDEPQTATSAIFDLQNLSQHMSV